ncbi:quaternary amine ABC transporter ATP-binding protein [Polycladidibacter stylochi]|uniref:quaternary amine ABC transporter ATP-binding protein n=1 Tax=Polycladidibacter stylochi TaxID=1807766 RepID=UPI0008297B59|nr:ATP-binding cassette domain-containing protein [Pseudovibrio stylochi]
MTQPLVTIENLSILFGGDIAKAKELLAQGLSREEIHQKTGALLAVHNVSLNVEQGELLVLMGLSGSGKSSLLRAVNGLNKATSGTLEVHYNDKKINPATCSAQTLKKLRRKHVAMVFQQFGLLPWRTVRDNIALALELSGMRRKQRRERVEEQLELVGLQGWGDKYISELSGGMQQRVGLARALATQAPLLLMDEPFSALDPLIRARLQDELLELQQKLSKTIIFVSHDLDEAAKLGNRIAIMESGRLVQIGSPQQIVQSPCDEYVSSFVAHMNPLCVLQARDIMSPIQPTAAVDHTTRNEVLPTTKIKEVIALKKQMASPLVVMENETPVGLITNDDILASIDNVQSLTS